MFCPGWMCGSVLSRVFIHSVVGMFTAMDRNSVPPKTKPPPPTESDSEEESETSDEETEDEEQAEGSDFESESDKSTADTTKKKLTTILPTKQQVYLAYVCINSCCIEQTTCIVGTLL